MHQLYVLFEHASGYALFRTTEFEEIAIFLPQVQKSILDISKFRSVVYLIAFHPFKGDEALENMKCVANGKLHVDLQLFLENNVPKAKKSKQAVALGIQESGLASSITETLGITCSTSGVVAEIIRGIRFHFHKLVKGYKDLNTIIQTQLGLGHHYSRAKININIHKSDIMIPQSMSLLDQLNKDINTLSLRVREWYSLHFPELIKIVPDTELYIKCIKEIKDRNNMPEDIETILKSILQEEEKVKNILEASQSSMGMEIAAEDVENIQKFIDQIISLIRQRNKLTEYLKTKMNKIAPNLSTLIGELVGARLISQAGNLINLSKLTASTVQILGAEKSLFRKLKTKDKVTPKFGSLNPSSLISKADRTTKGRTSRVLANKCSLASRIDCFSVIPNNLHGQNLRQQVEDRIKFYEKAELNPHIVEEKRKACLANKALRRKKKKDRKRKKLLSSNESNSKKRKCEILNGISEEEQEMENSTVSMEIEETEESHNVKENVTKELPKLKRKRKQSSGNLKR